MRADRMDLFVAQWPAEVGAAVRDGVLRLRRKAGSLCHRNLCRQDLVGACDLFLNRLALARGVAAQAGAQVAVEAMKLLCWAEALEPQRNLALAHRDCHGREPLQIELQSARQ